MEDQWYVNWDFFIAFVSTISWRKDFIEIWNKLCVESMLNRFVFSTQC